MKYEEFKNRCRDIYFVNDIDEKERGWEDKIIANQNHIGGALDKSFNSINDNTLSFIKRKSNNNKIKKTPKDSEFFEVLFSALKKGDSTYCTYFNDLFEDKKNIYIPENINCLVKNARNVTKYGSGRIYEEIICPRLANLFGVKTVFNAVYEEEYKKDDESLKLYRKILSVDFTPSDHYFIELSELGVEFNQESSLEECLNSIMTAIKNNADKLNITEKNNKNVAEEFVRQYIFRNSLSGDNDFKPQNAGLIINKDGDYEMSPMFDYEYMFFAERSKFYFEEINKKTFEYCNKHFPKVVEEFMFRVKKSLEDGSIIDVINNTIDMEECYKTFFSDILLRQPRKLLDVWEKCNNNEHQI